MQCRNNKDHHNNYCVNKGYGFIGSVTEHKGSFLYEYTSAFLQYKELFLGFRRKDFPNL